MTGRSANTNNNNTSNKGRCCHFNNDSVSNSSDSPRTNRDDFWTNLMMCRRCHHNKHRHH